MPTAVFDSFCGQVCSVIRWKPVHGPTVAELRAHLEDHAAALEAQGVPPEEAALHAVAAMGDPYELGHQLDKCHSPLIPRLSRIFALLALAALLLSLIIGVRNDTGIFTLRGIFPQPFPPPYVYKGDAALEISGTASGGGNLAGYQLAPSGEAELLLVSWESSENETNQKYLLRCPLSITQWQFWRPPMNFLRGELSWTDDAGGTGSAIVSSPAIHSLLGSTTVLEIQNPTPGARQFTVTLSTTEERVIIYITLQEEVPPL